jgi:hypothetical protein
LQVDAFGKSALLASAMVRLSAFPAAARSWRDTWTVLLNARRRFAAFCWRASFTYGGKPANSWATLYPTAERKRFDKVADAVARTYKPGVGPTGDCTG